MAPILGSDRTWQAACLLAVHPLAMRYVQRSLKSVYGENVFHVSDAFAHGIEKTFLCAKKRVSSWNHAMQNVGASLSKSSMMTFALNVTTATPQDNTGGSVWDMFSPLSKLITIACVDNKAQFEKDSVNAVRRSPLHCTGSPSVRLSAVQALPAICLLQALCMRRQSVLLASMCSTCAER